MKIEAKYYSDRVFFYIAPLCSKKASYILEKRILENRNIVLQDIPLDAMDSVSNLLVQDFCELIESVSTDKTFYEMRMSTYQVEGFSLNIAESFGYQKYLEEDLLKAPPYNKESLRVNDKIELSRFKEEYFDERYGIITNIYKYLDAHNISLVGCEFMYHNEINFSYGRGNDFKSAEASGLLELIERKAMYNISGETRFMKICEDKKGCLVNPKPFLFYDHQYSDLEEFNEDTSYYWLKSLNYKKKIYEYLPLQMFDVDSMDKHRFVLETSNGVALGGSLYESMLFALLEVIERDSFLLFWYKKVKVFQIQLDSIPDKDRSFIENYETDTRKVYLFDLTFDIPIPTILCLVISLSDSISTYISTAAHINPEIALRNAINEKISTKKDFKG